jgi:UDP-glucose 4-epimerase
MDGEIQEAMKILVTGATGLVGTNLVNTLRFIGHDLAGISRKTGDDLRDKNLARILIEQYKPDIVYHLAANAAESRGQVSPIDMTENNLNIFLNVLVPSINAGVKKFIYTSSVAVYGEAEVPYAEDDIPKPKDVYGVNKLAAEQILKLMAKQYNFDYTIFRPHNIYGPHQDMSNPYKNVVALFMRNLIEDKETTIFGEGKMKRAFSYVDDVVDILVQALDSFKGQTINLGSSIDIEIGELLKMIEEISGKKAKVKSLPARQFEIWNFLASHKKLNNLTTYHETPLQIGLQKTWQFLTLPKIVEMENEIK